MILVKTVDAGDAHVFHRSFLNLRYDYVPCLRVKAVGIGCVENGANFVDPEDSVEFGLDEAEAVRAVFTEYIELYLGHLAYFFVESHSGEGLADFFLDCRIGGDDRKCYRFVGESRKGQGQEWKE